ncbi:MULTISPECIES: hypothetical protein [unclassified Bradyrhizobium]|uniref:hypothetical protein n=1 Tax=unclassified Bradyrhizobium TaxID=2631580 RepID=UPI0012ECB284|nr:MULTISPECIES: hypothetical protein [unclassified Bradyrhizobium]QIG97887.1 hypothetical protein G6P99_40255 [Bradyrhizobium sp. 6(2017)]
MARFKNSAESSVVMRKSQIAHFPRHFFGTTSLFNAFDVASGGVIGKCYKRASSASSRRVRGVSEVRAAPNVTIAL